MRQARYNAYAASCPTRQALDRIADKWTVLIIGLLANRPHRFGELLRGIDGISQKMLTQTLRSLEFDGLVSRRVEPTVPVTVEYSLTATGRTLTEPLDAIRRWAEQHIEAVLAARSRNRPRTAVPR
jgi:DNA-binding HxlR family transcriptional regulator